MESARLRPWLAAALTYLALVVILTWPLASHLSSVVPHDLGDPLENTWILWWNAHAIPLSARWWNGPIFWPAPGALALSEHLLGISVFATPMQWLGASPTTTYNVVFLLSFPLCAIAAHALVFTLTARHDAGAVAGVMFGFNAYRIAESAHLQTLAAFWMPVALLALHQYIRRRDPRWLMVFGVAWLLQALSNGYFLLFFPVLIALWFVWFVRDWAAAAAIAAAWAVGSVPLMPVVWKYWHVHAMFNLRRDIAEIASFSPDVASIVDPGSGFPGFTGIALIAIAAGTVLWRSPRQTVSTITTTLFAASLAFAAISCSIALIGPWEVKIAGTLLASGRRVNKPITAAIGLFLAAAATDRRFIEAFKRRSMLTFFTVAAGAMAAFSLGPDPRFRGASFLYRSPYGWLLALPGFDALRVPARFGMLTILCVSAAAGLAFARLTRAATPATRMASALVIAAFILAESRFTLPLLPVPVRLQAIEEAPFGAVLEIPPGDTEHDTPAMYRSMFHRRPLLNGAAGFAPPHYEILRVAIDDEDEAALDEMASTPLVVAVDPTRENGKRWVAMLSRRPGARQLAIESGRPIFWVPAVDRVADAAVGDRLPIAAVSANVLPESIGRTIDSNLESLWHTGRPQRGGEAVTIDLGAIRVVNALRLSLGRYALDFPRRLTIDVSEDNRAWTTCWSGRPARLALIAAKEDPHTVPLTIPLPSVRARWIRLRQTGSDLTRHWSIPELAVFGR
jgi:hypothetical protein